MALTKAGTIDPRSSRGARLRALLTTLWVYAALLSGLVWILARPADPALGRNPVAFLLLVVASIGLVILGRGGFGASWGRRPSGFWLAAAPLVGLGILIVSVAWVRFARDPTLPMPRAELSSLGMLLATTALVAYSEEFLFRGVLWAALALRHDGPLVPILQTAALFAIAHIFGAGDLAELPHRFVAGLVLGGLRAYSGSLWPCLHVHFFVNLAAHLVR